MNVNVNNQIVKNLTVGFNINAASATPYTIRTGYDDNGDLIFNDRPPASTRNTERAASQFTINMNVGYGWSFGKPVGGPPGIAVFVPAAGRRRCSRSNRARAIGSSSSCRRRT